MHRFFAAPEQIDLQDKRIRLTGPDVNHLKNVLRMAPGEELWISDGEKKEYHCEIEQYEGEGAACLKILYAQEPDYELPCRITLYQGLPKSDKMEWIIQKAVELGADRVVPVITRRSVVKLEGARAQKKTDRWQQISESAAKQSRRLHIPKVDPVTGFSQALEQASTADHFLIPYELCGEMTKTREALAGIRPGDSVAVMIGPEGGFEEEEVRLAQEAGAAPISLGRRILRTETAGMTLLAALMLQLEI